ncbi:MAG: ABC transporter permease [Ilumatobacteraceae bacterium]
MNIVTASTPTLHLTAPSSTRTGRDALTAVPGAIKSEWIKLRSLRSTPFILAGTAVIGVLLSWILATFVKTDPDTDLAFTVSQTFIFSTWLTTMLASIVGALMFTSEVQHGTLPNAVMAQPARWVIVTAKTVVASGFGLVMGIVGMTAGFAGAVLGGLDAGDSSGVAATVLWGLFLTSMASLFGLGVGMILKHGAMATSSVLIWALVLENLIRGFAPPTISRYLPFSAAAGLLGIRQAGDTDETVAAALSRVQDAFLFGGYVVAAVAVGTVLLYRRDPN